MEAKYAIWLSERIKPATKTMDTLLKFFGSCQAVYNASKSDLISAGVTGEKALKALLDKSLDSVADVIADCEKLGVGIIPYGSQEYPARLLNIYAPPALLYVQGESFEVDDLPLISVVGTREPTEYGRRAAYELSRKLSLSGFTIVSGLAVGVDGAALAGAVRGSGAAIGVIGCGHGINYPVENYPLRREILKRGAVISEYSPKTPVSKGNFPLRNRIMAGLALGVMVIEAPEKSGALITAKYALEYGRDVFAVPGNINSYESVGSNRLVKDGAIAVTNIGDIIDEYKNLFPSLGTPPERKADKKQEDIELSEPEKKICAVLEKEPMRIEDIMKKTGLNISQALAALTMLEVKGKCKAHPYKRFSK